MKFSPFFGTAKIRLLCRICKFFAILFAPGLKSAFFCPVPGKSPYFWNSKKQPERAPRGSKTKKQTCVERKEIPHPIFHRVVPDVFRLDLPRGTTRGPLGGSHGFGAGVCVRRPSCWGGACRRGVAHALGLSGEKSGGSLAACGGVSGLGRAASGQCLCPGNFSRPAGDRLRSPLGRQLHPLWGAVRRPFRPGLLPGRLDPETPPGELSRLYPFPAGGNPPDTMARSPLGRPLRRLRDNHRSGRLLFACGG